MSEILITGGDGMVGRALRPRLTGACFITRSDCDLENRAAVRSVFEAVRPNVVIHLAAMVAGVKENVARPHDFYVRNMLMNTHVIDAAVSTGVEYVLAVSSACAYPAQAPAYPMTEDQLHQGPPAVEQMSYGLTKRCMSVQLDAAARQHHLRSAALLCCTLYGSDDKFDPQRGQFIPSLMLRVREGQRRGLSEIELLGTGRPRRQVMHVDDAAEVIMRCLLQRPTGDINVAPTESPTIDEIAAEILEAAGSSARRRYTGMLDGPLRRDMDTTRLQRLLPDFQFTPLRRGIQATYQAFVNEITAREAL